MQSHFFHGQWHIVDFQNLVVVSGNDSVERIADEAETEVASAKTSGLLRGDELSFTIGGFAPKKIASIIKLGLSGVKLHLPLTSLLFSLMLGGCGMTGLNPVATDNSTERDLLVWWSEGYYPEETDAIEAITRKWEKESGKKVDLVFFNDGEISQRATQILNGGPKPDLMYG